MKRKIVLVVFVILSTFFQLHAQSENDFVVIQNTDNTLTITDYTGSVLDVVIPDTLYGLKVTIIGGSAFRNKGITSVIIPNSVLIIENGNTGSSSGETLYYGAFTGNNMLTTVILGSGLQIIGTNAFCSIKISEIIIPDSVTTISDMAFQGYTYGYQNKGNLTRIIFGTGLQSIGELAFANNQISELNLPSSIKTIEYGAFQRNKIEKVTFGTGLQIIDRYVFRYNQIVDLNLPTSIKTIEIGAFANNQINSVIIPNGVTSINNCDNEYYTSWLGAFANNPITTVVIPATLANGGIKGEFLLGNHDSGPFGRTNASTITQITIPVGMENLSGIFEESFVNFWINHNRAGGTYIKRGPIWSRE